MNSKIENEKKTKAIQMIYQVNSLRMSLIWLYHCIRGKAEHVTVVLWLTQLIENITKIDVHNFCIYTNISIKSAFISFFQGIPSLIGSNLERLAILC